MNDEKQRRDEYLRQLAAMHDGRLTPEMVVLDAKRPESPLHGEFQWDTAKAAEQHWLDTARALIRAVRIEVVTSEDRIAAPYFVRDPGAGEDQGYLTTASLRNDPELCRASLRLEVGRVVGHLRRAEDLARYFDLHDETGKLRRRAERLAKQIERRQPTPPPTAPQA